MPPLAALLLILTHCCVQCWGSDGTLTSVILNNSSESVNYAQDQVNASLLRRSTPVVNKDVPSRNIFDVKIDLRELEIINEERERRRNFTNWDFRSNNLEELMNVFDVYRIYRNWSALKEEVGEPCRVNMEMYLSALNQSQLWAAKMWDATGRYSSGFFWGNGYWIGSQVQCYNTEKSTPFPLGFSVIKLIIHLPYSADSEAARVHVGLCLPYSCTVSDVRFLADASLPQWTRLLKVRAPHIHYDFWNNAIFWTLLCVSVLAVLMLIAGTSYDLFLDFTRSSNAASNPRSDCDVNHASYGTPAKDHGIFFRIIRSFSVKLNLEIICDPGVGVDTIPCIHGLRFLSMLWVILGHTLIVIVEYSDNNALRGIAEDEFLFQTVTNGTFAVDTFFFISGLLVSFLYFRTIAKIDVNKITKAKGAVSSMLQFLGLLIYRYLRLTVPYMFVLGVVQVCMKEFQETAVFEPLFNDQENCARYWWRNALYINNFFSANEMCMLWSWYLADDTQFYILGAVLLILATSHFRIASVLLGVFLATSWTGTAIMAYQHNHNPGIDDPLALFDKVYDKPWTRLGPYLIGMCVGWLLYQTDYKIKINKVVVAAGWLLSTLCALSLVYGLHKKELHPIAGAAYSSLSHTLWALALAWIVVACSTGYGGYANKLLSLSIIHPFSRVTYCAYLVHPLIIHLVPLRMDRPFHITPETVLLQYFGQVVASYMLAFIVSLAFEAPVVSLLKIMAPSKDKQRAAEETREWANFNEYTQSTQPEHISSSERYKVRRCS